MNYIDIALEEAKVGINNNDGGPFGAVIVDHDGKVISSAHNNVLRKKDPTAHAEVEAIRSACQKLNTNSLENCIIYSTCEPCPMCLSAIIWANIKTVYYAGTRDDASNIGFKDSKIYDYIKEKNNILEVKQLKNDKVLKIMNDYKGKVY